MNQEFRVIIEKIDKDQHRVRRRHKKILGIEKRDTFREGIGHFKGYRNMPKGKGLKKVLKRELKKIEERMLFEEAPSRFSKLSSRDWKSKDN